MLVSTHAGQELLAAGDRRIVLEDGQVIASNPPDVDRRPASTDVRPIACRQPCAGSRARPGPSLLLVKEGADDASPIDGSSATRRFSALLGLAAASAGIESASGLALQAFGRTTATLMNLCLLLAPLVAVLMGAASIAGERERGTLEHLLAQPLTRTRLLLAKHGGLVVR